MKIAILGTKGIPNRYGGFEQFAEYLSVGLVKRGYDVTVYNPNFHPYKNDKYQGVRIIRKFSPERIIGGGANVVYDFLCLRDALSRRFDIIYEAGYHSVALPLLVCRTRSSTIVTNMDGMEWQRAKWNRIIRHLIQWFEQVSVKRSDYLIADNPHIQNYFNKKYGKLPVYIAYGTTIPGWFDEAVLDIYHLKKYGYYLIIGRLEPENNIQTILDWYSEKTTTPEAFVVVGDSRNPHGKNLVDRYRKDPRIQFIGSNYNRTHLDALRHFSRLYFHGHSVGGTNPSLIEAMAAGALIVAHDNPYNHSVLGNDALYFRNQKDIDRLCWHNAAREAMIKNNLTKIRLSYLWEDIISEYDRFFRKI